MTKRGVVRLHNAFFNGELGEYGEIFINQIDSLGEQLGNFGEQMEEVFAIFIVCLI